MKLLLLASAGGAIGAGARYLVNTGMSRWLGPANIVPWWTFCVNVIGSFLMGMLVVLIARRLGGSQETATFLMTGILGGFTTFSAFSLDFAMLIERKAHFAAALYLAGSVACAILAIYAGMALAKAMLP